MPPEVQPETTDSTESPEQAQARAEARLASLRAEIDRLDDQLHDTLMRRAALVSELAGSGLKRGAPYRPAREAQILRRLLARHRGRLPKQAVVAMWREMLAATIAMQGPFAVAVWNPEAGAGTVSLAREHFGGITPIRWMRSTAQVLYAVGEGEAQAGVLPLPQDDPNAEGANDPWWISLMRGERPALSVIARLPFVTARTEGASRAAALVVAAIPPEASGDDRSLVAFHSSDEASRARIADRLAAAGLPPISLILHRPDRGEATCLAEVEGLIAREDPRLAALVENGAAVSRPAVIGGWPVPPPESAYLLQSE
jgi:chorismate mutase